MVIRLSQKSGDLGKLVVMNRVGKGQALPSEVQDLSMFTRKELNSPFIKQAVEINMSIVAEKSLNAYSQVQEESNGE